MNRSVRIARVTIALASALVLATACGGSGEAADAGDGAQAQLPPNHPPIEATGSEGAQAEPAQGALPPNHPPVSAPEATPGQRIAPPPAGSGVGAAALTWSAPEGWIPETPSSRMRRAQYRVPGPGGDAECVIYYFGPGQGGNALANAERWADQFTQPDGGSSRERMTSDRFEVDGIDVLQVEVSGTYNSATMMGGPSESYPGYMLLGAIAEGADANWFFKFTGPAETVSWQREAFAAMIRSLSRGG